MFSARHLVCAISVSLALGLAACSSAAPGAPAAGGKSAKRAGPDAVPPLRVGALEITAVHWGLDRGLAHNGGYIAALDAATGRELWLLEVYDVRDDPQRERDVQDTFIVEMTLDPSGERVLVRDELGRVWLVDPRTRTVRPR